ncbi:class I mannose-6-phosphate isomerase [Amycolatopsis sp. EV170708-02-1]|uniref:class I mannose-6-phosphate isomerase n=1 Tax=Amycolatopsis sp. EV170708-02-1 TaxID=2919322 RepID=UPI001F0B943E|nr:class I mannose-6-phosphate isomerase [Amycolatopsis sp. EV170708-02-1]UMP06549.1 class I mannose-6-phosphate isomerase [Amycolatopsis sp. EV170708-02-1]
MSGHLEPIRLPANQPPQFYRGGDAIAALRGAPSESKFGPEDWVGSATTMFGQETNGLTKLPSGVWLRDAVRENPSAWLGAKHVEALGDSTGLLVKLLDAGQRLPVHFHPSDSFAKRHFDSHFGKTEAWIVVGTYGDDPRVYPGFKETVDKATVNEWARTQDAPAMLDALNSVAVTPGDTVYIPAGLPHAIGEGVFVVELQQPTDFSLTLEWRDFLANPEKAHLGIGFETAIETLDTTGWDEERLGSIVKRTAGDEASTVDLLADGSDAFFRADQLRPAVSGRATTLSLDPSFAVLVVMDGSGTLRTEHGGEYALRKGETYVVPHDAGQSTVEGDVTVIRCRPPAPEKRERS